MQLNQWKSGLFYFNRVHRIFLLASILTFLSVVFLSLQARGQSAPADRPNIILFLVDDMGWQDCSVPFWGISTPANARFHTPNMERLARQGVRFTDAYAHPVCTPTRSSMLSGLNPAHSGISNWTSPVKDQNTDAADDQFLPAAWNINGLSPVAAVDNSRHATPYPELLKQAGYFTIHVGKAHWAASGTPGANPLNMGFLVNVAGHSAGHPQSYLSEQNFGNLPGKAVIQAVPDLEEYYGSGVFLTEALTREAIKTLDYPIKNKQPFFLHLSHYAVHTPLMGDPRFLQRYLNAGLDSVEARYASLIQGMDQSLGDVMDFLEEMDVAKNTIIMFVSDNGGLSLAPPRARPAHSQNFPLKAGKGSVYEGGIRVPMLVKWPAVTEPGSTANQYTLVEDFFPTILEMAGIQQYKTVQQPDGKSFVPLLRNPNHIDSTRYLIWHYPNKWQQQGGPGINYFSAIRQGRWKLVYSIRTGEAELYDLWTDITETKNVAAARPNKRDELLKLLGAQLQQWQAPMPIDRKTGKKAPWPKP